VWLTWINLFYLKKKLKQCGFEQKTKKTGIIQISDQLAKTNQCCSDK
jgi:hypothetical protein